MNRLRLASLVLAVGFTSSLLPSVISAPAMEASLSEAWPAHATQNSRGMLLAFGHLYSLRQEGVPTIVRFDNPGASTNICFVSRGGARGLVAGPDGAYIFGENGFEMVPWDLFRGPESIRPPHPQECPLRRGHLSGSTFSSNCAGPLVDFDFSFTRNQLYALTDETDSTACILILSPNGRNQVNILDDIGQRPVAFEVDDKNELAIIGFAGESRISICDLDSLWKCHSLTIAPFEAWALATLNETLWVNDRRDTSGSQQLARFVWKPVPPTIVSETPATPNTGAQGAANLTTGGTPESTPQRNDSARLPSELQDTPPHPLNQRMQEETAQ